MKKNLQHKNFTGLFLAVLLAGIVFTGYAVKGNDIDNLQAKVVNCYPSPATTFVNFEVSAKVSKDAVIQVYSFTGKKMTVLPVTASKITLNLDNDYYRGIYIYRLSDKSGKIIEVGKFQVVR